MGVYIIHAAIWLFLRTNMYIEQFATKIDKNKQTVEIICIKIMHAKNHLTVFYKKNSHLLFSQTQ